MPHFIVEYTDNLRADMRALELLRKGADALAAEGYPVHGMRTRAIEFAEYHLADGEADYGMVHATLKIAPGHTMEEKTRACHVVFEIMKAHFADLFARRYLMMSLELVEIVSADGPTLKLSNVPVRAPDVRQQPV